MSDYLAKGERAVVIEHFATAHRSGEVRHEVREFVVGKPGFPRADEMAGYKMCRPSLTLAFVRKRRRRWETLTVFSGPKQFCTVERDNRIVFDSRDVMWPPDLVLR